ncbi:hypothetical protein QO011_006784 [Labrys wisconsinensis]|uniref:Uncharacterized protein n=1 Tax=Labrys wisconsinensis TaxID=425677 RepID=A0ABU0JHJ2_9HYPH|nr:hypothetical protein [Labrys wisconsinensis]
MPAAGGGDLTEGKAVRSTPVPAGNVTEKP